MEGLEFAATACGSGLLSPPLPINKHVFQPLLPYLKTKQHFQRDRQLQRRYRLVAKLNLDKSFKGGVG